MHQDDPKTAGPITLSTTTDMSSFSDIQFLRSAENIAPIDFSDLAQWSFFFDLDGTLLDIAPSPDGVTPAEGLQSALEKLDQCTSGALAIVSGRSVDFVDRLFPGYRFSVAGLHGAQVRQASATGGCSNPSAMTLPEGFHRGREFAKQAAVDLPGVFFENKGGAFALHYRMAPEREADVRRIMRVADSLATPGYALQEGKFVIELKPSGSDKGMAVRKFMDAEPFRGRRPFAAGDDFTDETMFAAVNEMGGLSLRVGSPLEIVRNGTRTEALAQMASPEILRRWIRRLTE